ncbi:cytochrome P450 2C8, partial [Armadillidium vulgare]
MSIIDIDEHIATLDVNNPRDYIDEYLIEMEKKKDDPDNTMSRKDLLGCIADLFGAGLQTTSITLHWSIFNLATYPDMQKDLQNEVDNALPNKISPTFEDRSRMPKVEAFITEILRYSSQAIFGVPRTVSSDTNFAGYFIPKGSIVMAAQKMVQHDKNFYSSPESFNPQRFLDVNGKFQNPKEGFLPFGIGKK